MTFQSRVETYTCEGETFRLTLTPSDAAGAALLAQWAPPEDTYLSHVLVGESAMEPGSWMGLLFSLEAKPYWDALWNPDTPTSEVAENEQAEEAAYMDAAVFWAPNQKTPDTLAELRTPLMYLALCLDIFGCLDTQKHLENEVPFVRGATFAQVLVQLAVISEA